jgi:hypothetical protein
MSGEKVSWNMGRDRTTKSNRRELFSDRGGQHFRQAFVHDQPAIAPHCRAGRAPMFGDVCQQRKAKCDNAFGQAARARVPLNRPQNFVDPALQ